MADTKTLIEQAYTAFNKRDIDGALALMTEDVSWPKASEGGKVVGKEEIRAYWTRQWGEFEAGRVWTNCYHLYPAHAAFGGYKQSGIGRETHKKALENYQQTKCLLVSYQAEALGFF